MRGALKIFTAFGIPVFIHWTFGFIFVFILWNAQSEGMTTMETLTYTALFMSLFVCVLLHEYGHALAARRYGVKTQDIVLMPIGGVARLEKMPDKPMQEFVVAIAGPMVNVVIAILLILGIWLLTDPAYIELMANLVISAEEGNEIIEETGIQIPQTLQFAINLAILNIVLVIFNMIPAFPMDGGRVFRALLSMKTGRPKATRIASMVGQVIAGLIIFYGIWTNAFMTIVLGLFVIYGARSENAMVQLEDLLSRYTTRDLVRTQFTRINANDWMMTAIELFRHGLERHFLVFDMDGNLVGVLEEESILHAMKKPDVTTEVINYAHRPQTVLISDSLTEVHRRIRYEGHGVVAVLNEEGNLAGVVDEAALANFIRLEEWMSAKR
ncbi:MAG: site-2 protease family protein [Bacteroidota bacterium]|jgi:Zn-dependent protease|nr:site-2 protease family protein [Saprospiraceae bacterium]